MLEIIGSRYADPAGIAFPELLADNVNNQGLFVGPVLKDPGSTTSTRFRITITTAGGVFATTRRQASRTAIRCGRFLARQLSRAARRSAARRHDRDHRLVLRHRRGAARQAAHVRVRRPGLAGSDPDANEFRSRGQLGLARCRVGLKPDAREVAEPRRTRRRRDLARPPAGGARRLPRVAQPRAHARARGHPRLSPRPPLRRDQRRARVLQPVRSGQPGDARADRTISTASTRRRRGRSASCRRFATSPARSAAWRSPTASAAAA